MVKESTQLAAAAAWLEQQATQQKLKCETNRKTNLEGDAANVQAAALGSSWEQACNMVEFKIGCTKSERLAAREAGGSSNPRGRMKDRCSRYFLKDPQFT